MKPLNWIAAILIAFLTLTGGCFLKPAGANDGDKANQSPKVEAVPVEVETIGRGPIEEILKLSTSLEAEQNVKVLSRSANRVSALLVEEGDLVKKGDLLVRLENEIQTVAVGKAQNNLAKAKKEFERQQPLFDQNLISEQEFSNLRFELKQCELSLEDAQRELDYTEVRAPIDGTITRRLVNLGDYVTVNQHLFDLIDFNSIVALVYHPEKYLPQLEIGQPARVRATSLGEATYPAYVKRIAPVVESKTGTVKVTLAFQEIGRLRPGMHVDTEIVLAKYADALLIPKRALVYDGDQTYVFRLGADRKVERLLLEAKLSDKVNLSPVAGFAEGDQIVVAGQTGLKDGALVRLPEDAETSPKVDESTRAPTAAPSS